ncbi:unnamed protein product [Bursaphelenchus xylophilus]|uniref:(pine wood nematode) hypothetical protein n=1 Tax=Bursaphelenchus xylophilus TaxID=6326 RepID=A0A1I7RQS9_BURXY|nr:unnamed protein product [Bursaphelenchus xylophilus]CAG9105045.1 unnamed protein product [Bursaphelenchus xylophilus]
MAAAEAIRPEVPTKPHLNDSEGDEYPKEYFFKHDQIVSALLPLKKDASESVSRLFRTKAGDLPEPAHIATERFENLFILPPAETFEASEPHVTCAYSVWVTPEDAPRYQEKRTLDFIFRDHVSKTGRHDTAKEFFVGVTGSKSRDAVTFLINALLTLRDLPADHIKFLDVTVKRVSADAVVTVPASKDCETDDEVEDVMAGHVQTMLEYAYPNALTFEAIVEDLRCEPETVAAFVDELIQKGIAERLESGEIIRVNNFAHVGETKFSKAVKEKPPTIAIVTCLFVENLAVSSCVENANTLHMYNLNGDSNVYTIGNIGPHRVVVTKLPIIGDSREATISSGSVTTRLLGNFQAVEHVIIVGVGGGVPHYTDPEQHVKLGDVVVSSTSNGKHPAYVYGNTIVKDRISGKVTGLTAHRSSPKKEVFVELLKEKSKDIQKKWHKYATELIDRLNAEKQQENDFNRPPPELDVIALESGDNDAIVVPHPNADRTEPAWHTGTIASMLRYAPPIVLDENDKPIPQPSAQALRNGFLSEFNARAFDGGFDSVIQSIVGNCIDSYALIRCVADYHNGSTRIARPWQAYAAANAAAFTKALLESLPVQK